MAHKGKSRQGGEVAGQAGRGGSGSWVRQAGEVAGHGTGREGEVVGQAGMGCGRLGIGLTVPLSVVTASLKP